MAPKAPQDHLSMSKLQMDLERQQESRENALPIQTIGMTQPPSVVNHRGTPQVRKRGGLGLGGIHGIAHASVVEYL